jgi:hypothetical protein
MVFGKDYSLPNTPQLVALTSSSHWLMWNSHVFAAVVVVE